MMKRSEKLKGMITDTLNKIDSATDNMADNSNKFMKVTEKVLPLLKELARLRLNYISTLHQETIK